MNESQGRAPTLILGIGNILLRDEGIGVRVIEAMRSVPCADDVELIDGGTAGADLLDALADRQLVVVIDAMDAGAPPGTIAVFDIDELLAEDAGPLSLHELGLVDTVRMARQLGCAPPRVLVVGVQPQDVNTGLEMSAAVADAVPRIIARVMSAVPT